MVTYLLSDFYQKKGPNLTIWGFMVKLYGNTMRIEYLNGVEIIFMKFPKNMFNWNHVQIFFVKI